MADIIVKKQQRNTSFIKIAQTPLRSSTSKNNAVSCKYADLTNNTKFLEVGLFNKIMKLWQIE